LAEGRPTDAIQQSWRPTDAIWRFVQTCRSLWGDGCEVSTNTATKTKAANTKVDEMSFELKDGEGSLFKNDKKTQESHPDFNGSARLGGVDYVINGWKNTAKSGLSYLKLSMRPKKDSTGKQATKPKPDFNDDLGI
jgi:uncharacterized protein (DUF736 family)